MTKFFILILLAYSGGVSAQMDFLNSNNVRTMTAADNEGRTLLKSKYDTEIDGSPYVADSWANAWLLLSGGRIIKNVRVKINVESNELYFLDSTSTVLVANEGIVEEVHFVFPTENETVPGIFKCGYPAIDKQKRSFYYQVISEGKIQLLKKIWKEIDVKKDAISGEVKKEFVENSVHYIFCNGSIFEYRNSKDLLLQQMADKKQMVDTFLSANKINFKKVGDVEKLIKYYNSLK